MFCIYLLSGPHYGESNTVKLIVFLKKHAGLKWSPPAGAGGSPQHRDLPLAPSVYDCDSGSAGRDCLLATPRSLAAGGYETLDSRLAFSKRDGTTMSLRIAARECRLSQSRGSAFHPRRDLPRTLMSACRAMSGEPGDCKARDSIVSDAVAPLRCEEQSRREEASLRVVLYLLSASDGLFRGKEHL